MIIGPKFVCVGSHLYTLTMLSVAFSFFFQGKHTEAHQQRSVVWIWGK